MAKIPEAQDLLQEAEKIAQEESGNMAKVAIAVLTVGAALIGRIDDVLLDLSSIKDSVEKQSI